VLANETQTRINTDLGAHELCPVVAGKGLPLLDHSVARTAYFAFMPEKAAMPRNASAIMQIFFDF